MEEQFRTARRLLQQIISEQRAATEELRSNNRELEAILEEFVANRADLRKSYEETGPISWPESTETGREVDLPRLEKDATKVLEKGRETIRESMQLRLRAKRVRAALRTGMPHRSKPHPTALLSKRERQVLALIVEGKSSKEIAAELGISFKTAVTHRASIMGKLDVHEIASVVREAIRRGLV